MADEWNGRAALAKVRAFPRAEIADVLLDQAIFGGRRQHHQERGAVQNPRQPIRQSARYPRPKAAGHRRGRANVLVSISGAAAGFFVAQESRDLPAERCPQMRRQGRAPRAWAARAAQLLLREMPEAYGSADFPERRHHAQNPVRVLVPPLHAVHAAGHVDHGRARKREPPRQPCFRIIASAAVSIAISCDRLIVHVPFVFDEVSASPEDHVSAPSSSLAPARGRKTPRRQRSDSDGCDRGRGASPRRTLRASPHIGRRLFRRRSAPGRDRTRCRRPLQIDDSCPPSCTM